MPQRSPRWIRRSEERPAEILAAALAIFAERGFAATKLDDVARAAGISKGTVYLYFSTKEDLFRAVVRQEIIPVLKDFETFAAAQTGDCAPMLRHLISRLASVIETDLSVIPKIVLAESGNFPEIARFYADEVVARALKTLAQVIERGVARGEFRPIAATHVLPCLIGPVLLLALWRHSLGKHSDIKFDHHVVLTTHIDLLLRGLAP